MNKEVTKKNSKLIIPIIFLIISICNVGHFTYYAVKSTNVQGDFCCEMAGETEQDKINRIKANEEYKQEVKVAKKKFEKSKPINAGISIISLIGLIGSFAFGFVKKNNYNIKILLGVAIALNILLILIFIG